MLFLFDTCTPSNSLCTVNCVTLKAINDAGAFTRRLCDVVSGDKRRVSEAAASLGPWLVSIQASLTN